MIISELTMARLNNCNILSHFSHSGVDEIADNTCHFGINSFFADNGLSDVHSWLYFPADAAQMDKVVEKVFFQRGVRFIFSTRSKLPYILKEDGSRFFGDGYTFEPGKDDVILEGKDGYVVTFGDMLHRSYDAVLRLRQKGLSVGLVNKSTLNVIDEEVLKKIGATKFVLVAESWNQKTGVRALPQFPAQLLQHADLLLAARLEAGHLAARARPHAQVRIHGHHQGGLRRSRRADLPPGLGPGEYVCIVYFECNTALIRLAGIITKISRLAQ